MRITKLTDYAILLLCELKQDVVFSSKILTQKTKVPNATVNKIMRLLVQNGLCLSKEGKNGGFYLSRSLSEISLLDVISSIEGLYNHFTDCLDINSNPCLLANNCRITKRMKAVDNEIYNLLKNKYLIDLIA